MQIRITKIRAYFHWHTAVVRTEQTQPVTDSPGSKERQDFSYEQFPNYCFSSPLRLSLDNVLFLLLFLGCVRAVVYQAWSPVPCIWISHQFKLSSVWLLPVTSTSQPHFFYVWRAISNHSHHINGRKITACEYFRDVFQTIKDIKQVCDAVFIRSDDIKGLVWRWGGPVLPWKCQGLFLLASPAFTCIIHPSSNFSCPYFHRRKALTEKHAQAWAEHAKVALEGWSRISRYTLQS